MNWSCNYMCIWDKCLLFCWTAPQLSLKHCLCKFVSISYLPRCSKCGSGVCGCVYVPVRVARQITLEEETHLKAEFHFRFLFIAASGKACVLTESVFPRSQSTRCIGPAFHLFIYSSLMTMHLRNYTALHVVFLTLEDMKVSTQRAMCTFCSGRKWKMSNFQMSELSRRVSTEQQRCYSYSFRQVQWYLCTWTASLSGQSYFGAGHKAPWRSTNPPRPVRAHFYQLTGSGNNESLLKIQLLMWLLMSTLPPNYRGIKRLSQFSHPSYMISSWPQVVVSSMKPLSASCISLPFRYLFTSRSVRNLCGCFLTDNTFSRSLSKSVASP